MKNEHNLKDINATFDNERNELLIKEKLNTLSTEQLRTLHYILGYNCKEESTESLIEEFEGYGYSKDIAAEFISIFKRDNYLIFQKPY